MNNTLKLYVSNALIYGLGILLFRYVDFFQRQISAPAQQTLLWLFGGYLLLSPMYYAFVKTKDNKSSILLHAIQESITYFWMTKRWRTWQRQESVAGLFLLVKLFFLPIMFTFLHDNIASLTSTFNDFQWYPFLLTLLFTIDTCIFAFGYTFESPALQNAVKSVEPTLLGWTVTLICYPPFNGWVGNYLPWGANDYAEFSPLWLTVTLRVIIIFLLVIYVWASIALGAKASNLTNRGIVTTFPYSIVRHPAYAAKNLVWWLTLLPVITFPFALAMLFWTLIYFLRAATEERHLLQDPEYLSYCQKVQCKFIPGLL